MDNMTTTEITFRKVELVVEGDYTPEELEVRFYADMSGHPASPSEFEIDSIKASDSDIDIYELFSYENLQEIENLCLINIEK